MNQKVLVALTITAIILGVLNLSLLLIPNIQNCISSSQSNLPVSGQKMPLEFSMTINNVTEYYPIQVTVFLPDEIQTLFNCHIRIDYLTENNIWKTTSKDIGLVNYRDHDQHSFTLDADFNSNQVPISADNYYQGVADPDQMNIKIEAYGYSKP